MVGLLAVELEEVDVEVGVTVDVTVEVAVSVVPGSWPGFWLQALKNSVQATLWAQAHVRRSSSLTGSGATAAGSHFVREGATVANRAWAVTNS